MSQEKAQLIAPQGHFTVPGLNVAGVVTASSFSGDCTGTASSIAQGTNVVVGVMTASSFAGDVFGNAAGLSTTTAGLKLGIVTSTSFAGNFTGIGSGLTGTPNIVAGLVTATQFVGNTPGLAGGISAGKNLHAGIVTATTFYGDGSNLTGAGSTAYIRQTVSSGSSTNTTTNINRNDGNIINFEHVGSPTLAFYNTKTADDITIIRSLANPSFTTGAVDFDDDDGLNGAADSDLSIGTGTFTFEAWIYLDDAPNTGSPGYARVFQLDGPSGNSHATNLQVTINPSGNVLYAWAYDGSTVLSIAGSVNLKGGWHHIAVVRDGSNIVTQYVDGVADGSQSSVTQNFNPNSGSPRVRIGQYDTGGTNGVFNGKISNLRLLVGTALYTGTFIPPLIDLTNITNTQLLCCQSDSSTTTAAVGPTLSVNSDPTASSESISASLGTELTWTGVTWNGGTAPTLVSSNVRSTAGQVFNLTTADGGIKWYGYEEVNADPQNFTLWAWGMNTTATLGINNRTNYSSPVQIPGTTWSSLGDYFDGWNGLAINTSNELWSWGYNYYGGLGQNSRTKYSSPVQIPGTTWARTWNTGEGTYFGVKSDNTFWSWGFNQQGALGQNTANAEPGSCSSPVQVPGTTWSSGRYENAGGQYFNLSVKTDGTLWAWGDNGDGQLGDSSKTTRSSPIQIPGTTWSKVAASRNDSYAIKTDGTLWSWGNGTYGRLGQGAPTSSISSPKQVPGTTWSQIDGGYRTVGAIKTDGTLWMWGEGDYGAQGHNDTTHYSSPKQVPGTTWGSVSCGRYWTIATKTDNTLWTWGKQEYGALGQNSTTYYSSPVQVPGTSWAAVSASYGTAFALQYPS